MTLDLTFPFRIGSIESFTLAEFFKALGFPFRIGSIESSLGGADVQWTRFHSVSVRLNLKDEDICFAVLWFPFRIGSIESRSYRP